MDQPVEMSNLASGTEAASLLKALADAEIELKTLESTPPPKRTQDETNLAKKILSSARALIEALKKDYDAGAYDQMRNRLDSWEAAQAQTISLIEQSIQGKRLSLVPVRSLIDYIRKIRTEAEGL